MLNKLEQPAASRAARPRKLASAKQFTYREQYGVIVVCKGEGDQQRTYKHLTRLGYPCKVVVT